MQKSSLLSMVEILPVTLPILEGCLTANSKIDRYRNISCSISGGSDSDIMLDMCAKLDPEKKNPIRIFRYRYRVRGDKKAFGRVRD